MELKRTFVERSSDARDRVRLCGEVTYGNRKYEPEIYWFEVHEKYADFLSTSGNPWVTCLLPLAMSLGEPLQLCRPVDRVLLENASELMDVWTCWYPHLTKIPIQTEITDSKEQKNLGKTVVFFSGGVDSFFSALRSDDSVSQSARVDELLHVWGFDIPLRNSAEYQRMISKLRLAASALGKELVEVATNMRTTRLDKTGWGRCDGWGWLYHGSALASVGLALESRYGKVLINSSFTYKYLQPWGSHPLTDPLLSTSQTKVVHFGMSFSRMWKIGFLAKHDLALRFLHVCPKLGSDTSCGNCRKCYYTMTALLLLGVLDRCPTFGKIAYDVKQLEKVYAYDEADYAGMRALQALAVEKGRHDIAVAIERSFVHTHRVNRRLSIASWLGDLVRDRRFVWRYADSIKRWGWNNSLT